VPLILPNCGGDFQNYIHDLQWFRWNSDWK
jgi:hypothetical protein